MKMPAIFVGHGNPMIALAHSKQTQTFYQLGQEVLATFGRPKAILAISAHWYVKGNLTNNQENPRQIYDMYGFPQALYDVKYPAKGDAQLADLLTQNPQLNITIDDEWGIDHGTWSVLCHMFPKADIPVVQLSVNRLFNEASAFLFGQQLAFLRDLGYLIIGSGNVVHNLRDVQWDNQAGTAYADEFDAFIKEAVLANDYGKVVHHHVHPYSSYAVPTPDHFLPLLYVLGASQNEKATVFNDMRELGAISMTGYAFGV